MSGFHCRRCGEYHAELPLAFGADAPAAWFATPAEQRTASELNADQCVLNGEHFFVRGCLDLPIRDSAQVFRWLVWVSVSESSFARMLELWHTEGRQREAPYFGWLDSELPGYPGTLGLKVHVHTQPVGERAFVEVEGTQHPLAIEQREGLSWSEVHDRVAALLHGE